MSKVIPLTIFPFDLSRVVDRYIFLEVIYITSIISKLVIPLTIFPFDLSQVVDRYFFGSHTTSIGTPQKDPFLDENYLNLQY